jgi:hypothetical protein
MLYKDSLFEAVATRVVAGIAVLAIAVVSYGGLVSVFHEAEIAAGDYYADVNGHLMSKAKAAHEGGEAPRAQALQLVDFSVTCATSATPVVPSSSAGIEDAFIWNNSAIPVYVGGSSVGTSTGIPICTDTASCVQSSIALSVVRGGVYCKVSSGTVSVHVLSGAYAL